MVLIKNDRSLLPFDLAALRRVAIIGPNSHTAQIMGGGSSQVRPHHRTSPLVALRERWAEAVELIHEPGCTSPHPTPLQPWEMTTADGRPGFLVEYYDNPDLEGEPVVVQHGDEFRLQYRGPPGEGVPYPDFSARATATFTARDSRTTRVRAELEHPARLVTNGDPVGELRWSVDLDEGDEVLLAVELVNDQLANYGRTTLSCRRPTPPMRSTARAAPHATPTSSCSWWARPTSSRARATTVAISRSPMGRTSSSRESSTPTPTVVVVNSGGPVLMPWLDAAPAVLQSWFGGQEMGFALADVLDGTREPEGRMPFTVPTCIEHTPSYGNFPGEAGAVRYGEGLLIGHRWYEARKLPVAVAFGHGLGYTASSGPTSGSPRRRSTRVRGVRST